MLTKTQRAEYDELGYLRIPQAFSRTDAEEMADFIWARLWDLHGIKRGDRGTWAAPAAWVGLNKFKDDPVFQPLNSVVTFDAIDDLMGAGAWRRPQNWGTFLVKFPDRAPEPWTLPVDVHWHVDFHFTYEPRTPFALRVFNFLSEVPPHGGATLAVVGSHRLVERFVAAMTPEQRQAGYAPLHERLHRSHPWLARLTHEHDAGPDRADYFMNRETVVDGQPVRVEELCADQGDVILMHPWLLHAAAPNASDRPRFMLGKDIYAEAVRAQ
jgi:Phytanoyl-CoA dioxygenase (PhyH)